jgi:hypothetical protein
VSYSPLFLLCHPNSDPLASRLKVRADHLGEEQLLHSPSRTCAPGDNDGLGPFRYPLSNTPEFGIGNTFKALALRLTIRSHTSKRCYHINSFSAPANFPLTTTQSVSILSTYGSVRGICRRIRFSANVLAARRSVTRQINAEANHRVGVIPCDFCASGAYPHHATCRATSDSSS